MASLLFNPNRKKGTRAKKPDEWFGGKRQRGPMSSKDASMLIQHVWKPYWKQVAKNTGTELRKKGGEVA